METGREATQSNSQSWTENHARVACGTNMRSLLLCKNRNRCHPPLFSPMMNARVFLCSSSGILMKQAVHVLRVRTGDRSGLQTDSSLESEFTVSSLYLLLRLLFPFRFPPEILVCLQCLEITNSPSLDLCCYVVSCLLCADKLNVLIMKSAVLRGHTYNRDKYHKKLILL